MEMYTNSAKKITRTDSLAEDGLDVRLLASLIWREKYIVIAVTAILIMLSYIYLIFIATPTYRASSVVVMESREAQVMGMNVESILGGLSSDTSVVNTEVEVLKGRELMGRVVDELNLVTDPEFNAWLRPKGFAARLRDLLPGDPPMPPAPERIRDSAVSALLSKVTIRNLPQSLAFQITAETESSNKSTQLADTIARLYIDDQVRVKFEATKRAAEWLAQQVSDLKTELERSEDQIRRFQSDMSITSAVELGALDRQLKDTRDRRTASEAQLASITARERTAAQASDRAGQAVAFDDPQLINLSGGADSGDPAAEAAFGQRRAQLEEQMAQDALRLRGQAGSYAIAEQDLLNTINRGSQELSRLDQMTREAESSRLLYEHFQTRLKEAVAQQGIQQADSRILSQAVQSSIPATPRKGLVLGMATLLGFAVGGGFVLLRELRAKGIRTASELEVLTGRPVLGQIPLMRDRDRARLLDYLIKNPTSAEAEAIRNLRTSILLSNVDNAPQVIALTSSVPGEGKTTLTLALGQNLTAMGKRVLIIEGDVRRRTFKRYLQLSGEQSLVSVLEGTIPLSQATQNVPSIGDILLGDRTAVNAADLFSSEAFDRMVTEARKLYDIVLVDTPPVLVVPDARVIAQRADAAVFVVHWNHTSEIQVKESLHLLDMTNVRIGGLVLSQVDPHGMRHYGYGEQYGAYAAYGRKYYTDSAPR